MSYAAFGVKPFSADVDLLLESEHGHLVPLSQVGATFVIAASPQEVPPGRATVVVMVDGREHRRAVNLVNGMSLNKPLAMILADDAFAPF